MHAICIDLFLFCFAAKDAHWLHSSLLVEIGLSLVFGKHCFFCYQNTRRFRVDRRLHWKRYAFWLDRKNLFCSGLFLAYDFFIIQMKFDLEFCYISRTNSFFFFRELNVQNYYIECNTNTILMGNDKIKK